MEVLADGAAHFGQPLIPQAAALVQIHTQGHAVALPVTKQIVSLPLQSGVVTRACLILAINLTENWR